MENLKSMETLTIEQTIYEVVDAKAREDIQQLNTALAIEKEKAQETDAKYFEIDYDGIISLKPEYRGDASTTSVDSSGQPAYPFSVSDNGLGVAGSKISELPERIVIPAVINEIAVTGFQNGMFYHNNRVKEIVLPDNVIRISRGFCREALHLCSVENTESITHIEASAFNQTSIQKALFPNLQQIENSAFSRCPLLIVAHIGNTITEIPTQCFMGCSKLSAILGGSCVTSVREHSFFATRRLKNLPFLSQLTSIGDYAFFSSRVTYDWDSISDTCNFGTNATYQQFNNTDYWTGISYTACENELGSLFHQYNPEWVEEKVCNVNRTYASGCATICVAEIYSALEGVSFSSPKDFETVLETINPSLLDLDMAYISNAFSVLQALGYTLTHYTSIGQSELQNIYNSLSNGALIYKTIMVQEDVDGGHAVVGYGVNEIGELMVADSATYNRLVGVYENLTYSMPFQALGSSQCDVIIVHKPTQNN